MEGEKSFRVKLLLAKLFLIANSFNDRHFSSWGTGLQLFWHSEEAQLCREPSPVPCADSVMPAF